VEKPNGRRLLERTRERMEHNNKVDLKKYDGSGLHYRAVESVHKSSDSDSSIFKTSVFSIKAQYILITVNL
jgi:hypothetical protein